MPNLITTDNSGIELQNSYKKGNNLQKDQDPDYQSLYDTLTLVANVQLKDIVSENLLIFPKKLGENEDEIGELSIIELSGSRENAREAKIKTGNLMGFAGIRPKGQNSGDKNVYLTIRSRFSSGNNDFFMQYILQKVFSINLVDFKFTTGQDYIFNLMMFLFPYMLKKAMRQGIYRTYQTFRRNDANIKGTIDISRHIRVNIPFAGNVAYSSRERTADNPVIQLIRHTIEEIKAGTFGKNILNCDDDMRRNVSMIVEATPSYNRMAREKVIRQNIKPFSHPYYTDYGPLRKLCLAILRHKKISFSQSDKDEVYGILFDGAWLWEEYLDTVLHKCRFKHAKNKTRKNGISVYGKHKNKLYPDFYRKSGENAAKNIVLDAKYKKIDKTDISSEDLHQLIAYIHILPACKGGLIYPYECSQQNAEIKPDIKVKGTLNGYGGQIFTIGVPISKEEADFNNFRNDMQQIEESLAELAKKNFP